MSATLVRKVTVTAFGIAAAVVATVAATPAPRTELVVYKSATCGCCNKWVDYLRKQGFSVVAHDTSDMTAVKAELGVPDALSSCHTAIVGGYVIEGHVPVCGHRAPPEGAPEGRGALGAGHGDRIPGHGGRHARALQGHGVRREGKDDGVRDLLVARRPGGRGPQDADQHRDHQHCGIHDLDTKRRLECGDAAGRRRKQGQPPCLLVRRRRSDSRLARTVSSVPAHQTDPPPHAIANNPAHASTRGHCAFHAVTSAPTASQPA